MQKLKLNKTLPLLSILLVVLSVSNSYSQIKNIDGLDRLSITTSYTYNKIWENKGYLDNYTYGDSYHLGVGYKFNPVHSLELGSSYNNLNLLGKYYGVDLAYLFDVTACANKSKLTSKWQFLLKSGVGLDFNKQKSVFFSQAARLQYNPAPFIGIYLEPKAAISTSNNSNYQTLEYLNASASAGLSFNLGGVSNTYKKRQKRFYNEDYTTVPSIALKTNLLFDILTVLNIELEIPIKQKWSIAADYLFPWWIMDDGTRESRRDRLQILNANLEGRYWLGNRETKDVLTGWYAGVYAGGGLYDLEYNGEGYQGEFFVAAGIGAGYAHKINKKGNLRMEYSLGVGYLKTNYRKYEAAFLGGEWHPLRRLYGTYTWIGPTKAKASLVWLWYRPVKKRGGRL